MSTGTTTLLFKTGVPLHGVQGEEAFLRLPLANLALAAYMRERGEKVRLHDVRTDPVESADFDDVDIVGISCMTGPCEIQRQASRSSALSNKKRN